MSTARRAHGADAGAKETHVGLSALLGRAGDLVKDALDPNSPIPARLSALNERLLQQRLQLAILGQFKRGKSSFVNALLGAPVLPSAVVPLTAIATFIAFGPEPSARVSFRDGSDPIETSSADVEELHDFLFRFVAEEANPNNRLGVAKTELFYPSPLLSGGTVLIDTPGIGSTFKHNTEAALRVIPECDAGFFVVSTDPPITEAELDYLEQLRLKVSRLFIVVNKIDAIAEADRDVLIRFLAKVLAERALPIDQNAIFQVSAREGLAAKLRQDQAALERSGIAQVEQRLLGFLASEKRASLEQAIRIKALDLVDQATAEIDLRRQALRMPLDQLQAKTAEFEDALRGIGEERRVVADLLAGEKRRSIAAVESRIERLRREARAKLEPAIDTSLAGDDPHRWERAAQQAIAAALEQFFEAARDDMTRTCSAEANAILDRFQKRIDALVAKVRRTAAELFDIAFSEDIDRDSYTLGEDPYWVTEDIAATLIPDPSRLIDRMLPLVMRRNRLRARLLGNADQLIVRNAENLRWAVLRGFEETFRRAVGHLEERLDDAMTTTRGVIERSLADRRNGLFVAEPEIDRLSAALRTLVQLRAAIGQSGVSAAAQGPLFGGA